VYVGAQNYKLVSYNIYNIVQLTICAENKIDTEFYEFHNFWAGGGGGGHVFK
jgi:hypothetical protein